MYKDFLSISGLTLISRMTGFCRDILLAALLGAGILADAFVIAFRLPNHFRAIFGEGAFNAAYIPTYNAVLHKEGREAAKIFSNYIFSFLLMSQVVFLILALIFTKEVLLVLAPGLQEQPEKMILAVQMTRITFPYLVFITIVTLYSAILNAHKHFIASSFAPILLNLVILLFLSLSFLFPHAGKAASWGITCSGILQWLLLFFFTERAGLRPSLSYPRLTESVRHFFRTFLPAIIGATGVQISLFADTIFASWLPAGGQAALYYAERIYQLPIGLISIAAGTILLPEMSRHMSLGHTEQAYKAQNRTLGVTLALSAPWVAVFFLLPDLIMRAIFVRGAFTLSAAQYSSRILYAYATGLLALILIRPLVASFQSVSNTFTPMVLSLFCVLMNVCLKYFFYQDYGATALAGATAASAWLNFFLLTAFAWTQGRFRPDSLLIKTSISVGCASFLLSLFLLYVTPILGRVAGHAPFLQEPFHLFLVGISAAFLYGIAFWGSLRIFQVNWRELL